MTDAPKCQCTSIGMAEDMCGPLPNLACPVHEPEKYERICGHAPDDEDVGFTWYDVDVLRDQAILADRAMTPKQRAGDIVRSIADRIAALLPPREGGEAVSEPVNRRSVYRHDDFRHQPAECPYCGTATIFVRSEAQPIADQIREWHVCGGCRRPVTVIESGWHRSQTPEVEDKGGPAPEPLDPKEWPFTGAGWLSELDRLACFDRVLGNMLW